MAEEGMNAGISAKVVETTEKPFIPPSSVSLTAELEPSAAGQTVNTGQAAASLFAELTPTEQESSTYYSQDYLDFYKNFIPPVYTEVK